MNKNELIKRYASDGDDKLLLAQVLDKLKIMEERNILSYTKFLNEQQRSIVENFLPDVVIQSMLLFPYTMMLQGLYWLFFRIIWNPTSYTRKKYPLYQ